MLFKIIGYYLDFFTPKTRNTKKKITKGKIVKI